MTTNRVQLDTDTAERIRSLLGKASLLVLECCDQIAAINDQYTLNGQRTQKLERFVHKTLKWSIPKFVMFVRVAKSANIQRLRSDEPERLPLTWTALYEISCMDDAEFADALKQGVINQDATVGELKAYRGKLVAGLKAPKNDPRTYPFAIIYTERPTSPSANYETLAEIDRVISELQNVGVRVVSKWDHVHQQMLKREVAADSKEEKKKMKAHRAKRWKEYLARPKQLKRRYPQTFLEFVEERDLEDFPIETEQRFREEYGNLGK